MMKINVISEADLTNNFGHGIWSAYKQQTKGLEESNVEVERNKFFGGDYDLIHMHTFGPFAYFKAHITKKPLVISCHTLPKEAQGSASFDIGLSYFFEAYLPAFYSKADVIITPSIFTKNQLKNFNINRPTYVVSNGVDTKKFVFSAKKRSDFRKKYGIKENEVVVYNVAQVIMRKGLDIFLEMAKRFPNVKFIWIGRRPFGMLSGGYMKIRYMINTAPKNVIFTGYVDDVVAAHCAGDIFFSPTRFENECISLLEAASVGNPPLVSTIPVFDVWLNDGKNCMKASTMNEYGQKLGKMVKDKAMRKKIGLNSKKVAEERDIKNISNDLINVYKIAMKTKDRARRNPMSMIGVLPVFVFGSMIIAFLYAKDKILLNFMKNFNKSS